MTGTIQALFWVAREFTTTVIISFVVLSALLDTLLKPSAASDISYAQLLQLVVACTAAVFACLACVMGVLYLVIPARAEKAHEPEDGLAGVEKREGAEGPV
ncbi:hypothetical protein BDZ94DRAFT_1314933 [Collybia nuda]|uniref:Uncharacterized protein n=1 Tax=Collybia nuda TaxID=64659 RepID=A0A9P6CD32_9AGAR|nr:hypothetical protein BDZ94DRAFT_1314933 [Collybia nuda]